MKDAEVILERVITGRGKMELMERKARITGQRNEIIISENSGGERRLNWGVSKLGETR